MKVQFDIHEIKHMAEKISSILTSLEANDVFTAKEDAYSLRAFISSKFAMLENLETDFGAMD